MPKPEVQFANSRNSKEYYLQLRQKLYESSVQLLGVLEYSADLDQSRRDDLFALNLEHIVYGYGHLQLFAESTLARKWIEFLIFDDIRVFWLLVHSLEPSFLKYLLLLNSLSLFFSHAATVIFQKE